MSQIGRKGARRLPQISVTKKDLPPGVAPIPSQEESRPASYMTVWYELKELLRRVWQLENGSNNGGPGSNLGQTFATIASESATLPNSRQLAAGSNITLTDGGAGSTLTIAATSGGSGTVTSLTATAPIVITPSPTTTTGVISHTTGTSGIPLIGQGASAPVFGTAVVAGGGTGDTTLAAHGVLIGEGTSPVNVTGTGNLGDLLTSNGASSDPTFQPPSVTHSNFNWYFGTGADGVCHLDGVNTFSFATLAGNIYTMTAQPQATTMTIDAGVTLKTQSLAVYCSVALVNNGTIQNNGGAAAGVNAGTGVLAQYSNGSAGGAGTAGGFAGNNGNAITNGLGGAGGNGGSTVGGASAGGTGGTVAAPTANAGGLVLAYAPFSMQQGAAVTGNSASLVITYRPGAGGGGGAQAGTAPLGTSGAGGGGAGFVAIFAFAMSGNGAINAIGGNGSNAVAGAGTPSAGGGGGGGGGGVVMVITTTTNWQSLYTISVVGGTKGTGYSVGGWTGNNGVDGSSGRIMNWIV